MKPPLAKILDVFGRFEGLAVSLLFSVLGLILMASCTSVQIYAAANIFYWVGYKSAASRKQLILVACFSPSKSLLPIHHHFQTEH